MSIVAALCYCSCFFMLCRTIVEVIDMRTDYDWMESPTGRYVKVFHDKIEDLAQQDGIDTKAEDMDDDTYYKYMNKAMGW